MKLFLSGDNDFQISRELSRLTSNFDGQVDYADAGDENTDFTSLILGQNLFSAKRFVVIRNVGDSAATMDKLAKIVAYSDKDIDLVVVASKADKRLKAYKDLVAHFELKEYSNFSDRDSNEVEKWLSLEAKNMGLDLSPQLVREIVARVGLDQWNLLHALEKIELLEEINIDSVSEIIEATASENVFRLIDMVMSGDKQELVKMLSKLQVNEDAFRLFALVSSQLITLAALASSGKSSDAVARDLSASPYMLSKLSSKAKKMSAGDIKKIIEILTAADKQMKHTTVDPWVILTKTLIKIAEI